MDTIISDYYGVNARHGTLGDFVEFTHGAKQRGVRVIMDLVVNHTSDRHPWFQEARRDLRERNCARTPMQWSTEPHAGFTKSAKPIMPVISEGPYGYEHVNVAEQRRDPNSLLNWTERMILMRKEVPEIGWGDLNCSRREIPRYSQFATTGETIQSCSSIIWMRFPGRWRFPPDCGARKVACW